jgi:hypothetical protein
MTSAASSRAERRGVTLPPAASPRRQPRGQVLVLFAFLLTILVGMAAFVIDIAWIWSNQLRVQRAADAAALAGVVHLPGDVTNAVADAHAESRKNGYQNGTNGIDVDPRQDPTNGRMMLVTVSAPVDTFFMRLFGFPTVTVTRDAKAEYVLPVPMGSPENYYGVFGTLRTPSGGTTITTPGSTDWLDVTSTKGTAGWTTPGNVVNSDGQDATTSSTSALQAWGNFGVSVPGGATITGIELAAEARRSGAGSPNNNCRVLFDLSWNNGSNYTTGSGDKTTPALTTSDPADPYYVMGSSTDLWNHSWTTAELNNTNFRVRAQATKPSCNAAILHRIDHMHLRVHYTTSIFIPDANVTSPYGDTLNARGFWGTMISQGAEDINGDAYLARYEDLSPLTSNAGYTPAEYYDYAVEIPAGAAAGEVWIYDPVFCATNGNGQYGTGDRWFGGTSGATSAFYILYNTGGTPYNLADDTQVATSGTLFSNVRASDASLNGPTGGGITSCRQGDVASQADGRYWHNRWWQLAGGLGAGEYRVRTTSTDPADPNAQNSANGHNSFAIWSRATGGSPRVYGIGAMEAFTPLDPNGAAEFYLAQIEAVHAGKTMIIELWDPGDTGQLSATLQILIPTATGYAPASFTWNANEGTVNGNCTQSSGSGTSVTTNTGFNNSVFNGCWVTIEIPIPTTYSAPTPPGELEPGWWKIRYNMGNQSATPAFDLTTWQVEIRGNPVHLVVP